MIDPAISQQIQKLYLEGYSPADLSPMFNLPKGTIKEHLRRRGLIRSMSEAAKLAVRKGKKDKAIKALIITAKTTNRFHPKKGMHGSAHPKWIEDRSKLKKRRCIHEELMFFKEVMKNYTCQLTGDTCNKLSVHHIKPVWACKELMFDYDNVIVIKTVIHKHFHKRYGLKSTEEDWLKYVANQEYKEVLYPISQ